jgi:UDP-N-acetylglucosamine--N-acetylmuramyl-(pentapeptide) pyrophosphoryl-undecaprenol N-acetylglucosamine transferase
VFGGSKGARSINRALFPALPALLPDMQVVHVSGTLDWSEAGAALAALPGQVGAALAQRYHAYPYLHEEMGAALAAADLVVSRAGASSLGEFPQFGLPSILVPYPYAWRYQRVNAEYLQSRGAAVMVKDADLPQQLVETVRSLLLNPARLQPMRAAAASLARPDAAAAIAHLLVDLALARKIRK